MEAAQGDGGGFESIYRATTLVEAELELTALAGKWTAFPSVAQLWRRHWDRITPFFQYAPEIRKVIYTTNAVEALNRSQPEPPPCLALHSPRSNPKPKLLNCRLQQIC